MRGSDEQQGWMFSYISPEKRVPQDHPLRSIRTMVDEALRGMSSQFAKLYSRTGRPSVAPEKLIRALLLQALYSIRSERLLIEELEYNLLFRWFVGLRISVGERFLKRYVATGGQSRAAHVLYALVIYSNFFSVTA